MNRYFQAGALSTQRVEILVSGNGAANRDGGAAADASRQVGTLFEPSRARAVLRIHLDCDDATTGGFTAHDAALFISLGDREAPSKRRYDYKLAPGQSLVLTPQEDPRTGGAVRYRYADYDEATPVAAYVVASADDDRRAHDDLATAELAGAAAEDCDY